MKKIETSEIFVPGISRIDMESLLTCSFQLNFCKYDEEGYKITINFPNGNGYLIEEFNDGGVAKNRFDQMIHSLRKGEYELYFSPGDFRLNFTR